jgi:DNA polymerase I-like protein with 3'-5' exonuclease and polymerase domains
MALTLGVELTEAKRIINSLTEAIPGYAKLKASLEHELASTGRIELCDGRRIQVSRAYKSLNYLIQGSAAIVMKWWVLLADGRLKDTSYRVLAVVHDELQGEALPAEAEHIKQTLQQLSLAAGERLGIKVPITSEAKDGSSWAETH